MAYGMLVLQKDLIYASSLLSDSFQTLGAPVDVILALLSCLFQGPEKAGCYLTYTM